MKKLLIIIFFYCNYLFSKEILLPLINESNKDCYIFSSLTGEITAKIQCEDIGKPAKELIPVKKNNKWGFVNKFGNWVIPNIYDFADNFYSNLARVRIKDKYGFIDKNNQIVIPIQFNYVGNFSEQVELAPFQCENYNFLYGYINKKGEKVIKCQYQIAYEFRNQFARARKWDLYGFLFYDTKKNLLKEFKNFQYDLAGDFGNSLTYVFFDKGFFLLDHKGNHIKVINENWVIGNFSISNKKSLAVIQDLTTGLYGYIDESQKVVIPVIFLRAYEFYLDYAKVKGPVIYQNPNIKIEEVIKEYQQNKYEEFYIDTEGRRITFFN